MNPYTVVTVMLGMNRFHQKDADFPFDMTALDGYNTIWMPEVDEEERVCSTLFYEALQAVEIVRNSTKDDVVFIFGRGTIGRSQEERLFEAWRSCMQHYGNDVRHVIVAKSFGVGDTMTALKMFKRYHKKPKVEGLFLIDGFIPPSRRRKIAKKKNGYWRIKIPKFVNCYFNVIQRAKGTKGISVLNPAHNFVVTQKHIEKYGKYYSEYKGDYKRLLTVSHFNMEEIVSAVPCIKIENDWLTLRFAIQRIIDRCGGYYKDRGKK